MNEQTTSWRSCEGAGEQSQGMPAMCSGAIDFEFGIGEVLTGGTRYGAFSLVALEVVGVPVRRVLAIDDELSWLWERERRLEEVRMQLANERRWDEWEMLCARLRKVAALSENLWRRWSERRGAAGICKAMVVKGGVA